jgi:hypothetical protein
MLLISFLDTKPVFGERNLLHSPVMYSAMFAVAQKTTGIHWKSPFLIGDHVTVAHPVVNMSTCMKNR